MSKIIVDSDEYFKLKEKLNKLLDINKSLKEKYTQLQKKSIVDAGFSIEKYDKLKTENESLKKDITFRKQETNKLENDKKKLIYDITLFKNENEKLKTNINELKNKNKELNSMIEEFENRKKTKNEINKSNQTNKNKEFDINDFNKDYEEFIKKLKEKSQHETIQ